MPFRFANQRALFTYKYHLPKDEIKQFFNSLIEPQQVAAIEIAHESGANEDIPYDHTHVVVDFGKQFNTQSQRRFDFTPAEGDFPESTIHPNIRTLTSKKAFEDALVYISKEDPECAHLKKTVIERIWDNDSIQDAFKGAKLRDVMAIETVMKHKPQVVERSRLEYMHEWQTNAADILENQPAHSRHIHWHYDPVGNTGKTFFVRKFYKDHPDSTVVFTQFGGQANTACVIKNFMENANRKPKVVLVDLARSFEDKMIYEPLENLKNGLITNLKYQGSFIEFDIPHVVVFANFLPKVRMLSLDRWMIYKFHSVEDVREMDVQLVDEQQQLEERKKIVFDNKSNLFSHE